MAADIVSLTMLSFLREHFLASIFLQKLVRKNSTSSGGDKVSVKYVIGIGNSFMFLGKDCFTGSYI